MSSLIDMSSIVPIVLSLLLFFGTLVYVLNTVSERDRRMDMLFTLLEVSNRLTEKGVITEDIINKVEQSYRGEFRVCIEHEKKKCNVKGGEMISLSFPVSFQEDRGGIPFNDVKIVKVIVWQGE